MNRLNRIKESLDFFKNTGSQLFSGALLEDFEWLIEQAEKAERLEKELERVHEEIVDEMRADLVYADNKITRYEKAIEEALDAMNGYDRFRFGDELEQALKKAL